ncbi:embryo defective [Trifolium repens]|nr:embryo defective [Trifolium repens]
MEKSPVTDSSNASSTNCTAIGYRFSTLNKSFKFALRSLLTSCSKEEFFKAFSSFTNTEKDFLHRLFLQVITSLHEGIEEDFEAICHKTKVGATLDAVEEIVEEQDLDLLFTNRSNIADVVENLSTTKKNEIQHLMHMVQLGEEHNQRLRKQLQLLKEGSQVLSDASHAVEKIRSMNLNYVANSSNEMHGV